MPACKQIILIRRDLGMRRGKEIAQGAHAAMQFLAHKLRDTPSMPVIGIPLKLSEVEVAWLNQGMPKVCVKVESEEQLLERFEKARAVGIPAFLVRDAGKTEFAGVPTLTSCAIGPFWSEQVDEITGDLKLY